MTPRLCETDRTELLKIALSVAVCGVRMNVGEASGALELSDR
jgi:hypothetical protein